MSELSLRRRQARRIAARRDAIAQTARDRANGLTPHLDGACPECAEGEAHEPMPFTEWVRTVVDRFR